MFQAKAKLLRKVSNSSDIEITAKRVHRVLFTGDIPCLIAGGYAVQENGYPRFTSDVDVIVPNVSEAREYLSIRGFKPNPGSSMTLTDRETRVEVDLLPGGSTVGPGPLVFPMPTKLTTELPVMTLQEIIASKLSTYIGAPKTRLKDAADVQELMKANHPPENLELPSEVVELYHSMWSDLFN